MVEEFGLKNVEVVDRHVRVKGKLASYNINMVSGVIHKAPEYRYICIVPANEEKKSTGGNDIYLPYAETDRKVREIISKILLLSNDDKIEDKLIMQQIDVDHSAEEQRAGQRYG